MPDDKDFLARSFGFLQESIRKSGPAAAASYTLIGAIILLGFMGVRSLPLMAQLSNPSAPVLADNRTAPSNAVAAGHAASSALTACC